MVARTPSKTSRKLPKPPPSLAGIQRRLLALENEQFELGGSVRDLIEANRDALRNLAATLEMVEGFANEVRGGLTPWE